MTSRKRHIETLPSGLTILLNEYRFYPAVIFDMWVKAGSVDEDKKEWGMAHFIEHMMFTGNREFSKDKFYEKLFEIGADDNACTHEDVTNFYIASTSEQFENAFRLHHALITSPKFLKSEFLREREVVLEEIKLYEDDPCEVIKEKTDNALFADTNYGHPILGTVKTLKGMTPQIMRDWHRGHYRPENMLLVITGDFEIDKILPMVREKYSDWKPEAASLNQIYSDSPVSGPRIVSETADINATYLSIYFKGPPLKSMETYALDVLMEALGGSRSARLNARLYDELNIINELESYCSSRKHAGVLGIDVELTRFENLQQAIDEIFLILSDVASNGLSAEEVESAKPRMIAERVFSMEKMWRISEFNGLDISLGSLDISDKYIDRTNSVTAEQVRFVASKYLRPENMSIGTNHPRDEGPVSISLDKFTVKDKPVEDDIKFGEILKPFSNRSSEGDRIGEVIHETLPNGVEFLYRNNPANPSVSIQILSRGGLSLETPDTNGIVEVMQGSMWKGTRNKSLTELLLAFDRLGSQVKTVSESEALAIDSMFLARDFAEGMKLIAEFALEPSFPEDEVEKVKEDVIDSIIQSRDDIAEVSLLNLRSKIYGNLHPYGRHYLGDETAISKLTVDQLRWFHSLSYRPGNIVIGIVGDVPFDQARDTVGELFAHLPQNSSEIPNIPEPSRPNGIVLLKTPRDKSQVRITVGRPGPSMPDPDYPAAKLLDIILGGTSYSRLFKIIRDSEGLAYDVYTNMDRGLYNPLFLTYMGTGPENYKLAIEKIRDEYRRIASEGPSEKELNDARSWIRGHNIIWKQGNAELAGSLAMHAAYGLPYDFDLKLLDLYKTVTVSDIIESARKYCDPDNLVISVCGPVD